jgi:sugar phosphate isomerase/epimerase
MIPFIAKQNQLEQKISQWLSIADGKLQVDTITAYSGHTVYALTLSDFSVQRSSKKALYVAQPHAHEPGTTAGMVDVIEQLLTGKDLLGNPSKLDRESVLTNTLITFNPIGNPYGRENAPQLYYDGSRYGPEPFRCLIFGEDPEQPGKQWKRVDLWDIREENAPNPIGIVYEPVDEFRYAEPNRCQLSSYLKLFHKMDAVHHYDYWLDLHQMMFLNSKLEDTGYCCQIFLPTAGLESESIAEENRAWAADITKAWLDNGFAAANPISSPYSGQQAEYFRRNYGDIHKRMNRITTEVITNRPGYPLEIQVKAQSAAIETTLQRLVKQMKTRSDSRMKIAFQTLACPDWNWDKTIAEASRLGYDGIELRGVEGEMYLPRARPFLPDAIDRTIRQLKENNLEICCLDTSCSFHDENKFAGAIREGKETIDLAVKLGTPYIRVFGDKIPDPAQREKAVAAIAAGLDELGRYAEGKGVTVLLETHGDINQYDVIRDILGQVGSPSVGVLWDFEHPFMNGEAPKTTFAELGAYIKHTHVKDARKDGDKKTLTLIGEGQVPIEEIVGILKDGGYNGWLSLEFEKKWKPELEEPEVSLPAYISYIKTFI